jgi:hypothetical protein
MPDHVNRFVQTLQLALEPVAVGQVGRREVGAMGRRIPAVIAAPDRRARADRPACPRALPSPDCRAPEPQSWSPSWHGATPRRGYLADHRVMATAEPTNIAASIGRRSSGSGPVSAAVLIGSPPARARPALILRQLRCCRLVSALFLADRGSRTADGWWSHDDGGIGVRCMPHRAATELEVL